MGVLLMEINEDNLAPTVINLNANKNGELNESWLQMFGNAVKGILSYSLDSGSSLRIPPEYRIRGTSSQINSFARALKGEEKYLKAASEFGLDDPKTFRSKSKLDVAIRNFERKTGIKWPFK